MPAATGSFKAPKPGNANPSQARKQATTTNKTKGKGRGRKCKMQEQEQDESIPSRGRGRGRKRKNPEPLEQDESIASLPLVPPSIEESYVKRRNPPVIVYIQSHASIGICSGCPEPFDREAMQAPYNMIFRVKTNRMRPLFDGHGCKTWVKDRQKSNTCLLYTSDAADE